MSEPKAQLVAPKGNFNLPGMNATGVITATFSGTGGVVTNLTGSPDLDVGIVTGSSFVGDGTGHAASLAGTPELNLGITTATSFTGDATGKAAGLRGTPNLNVGLITATSFVGFVTGNVTGNLTGNVTGLGASVKSGVNLGVGVCTALELYGDGSTLTGAGSSAFIAQNVNANVGEEAIIDLSDGNLIYYTGNTGVTVGFASTSAAEQITLIRNTTNSYSLDFPTGAVDFSGTDQYLSVPYINVLGDWFNSAYCIEYWVYADAFGVGNNGNTNMMGWTQPDSSSESWSLGAQADGTVEWYYWNGSQNRITTTTAMSTGEWTHLAMQHDGSGGITIYINGVAEATGTKSGSPTYNTSSYIMIGHNAGSDFNGKISNLRVTRTDPAVYSGNFIPPGRPLQTASNTLLLCCQDSSSATAATKIPTGTISATGSPTVGSQTITQSGSHAVSKDITWPDRVSWNNDTTPTLISNDYSKASQIFHLTTFDTGLTYNAWEEMKNDTFQSYELWSWGTNGSGMLGQNSETQYSSPVQISGNWSRIVTGNYSTGGGAAIRTDKTLWAWGYNDVGALAQNDRTTRSSPTQIPGAYESVSWSYRTLGAVKTDGTLWTVGKNNAGQLGQNDGANAHRSSPVQVGTDTTWGKSSHSMFNNDNFLAVKTDGTLWSWGTNTNGQLGHNQAEAQLAGASSPTQIPGSWSKVSGGNQWFYATKTEGTLWAWGLNNKGQLGNDNTISHSSPVQIPGTTWNIAEVAGSVAVISAFKTDGSLWGWGDNVNGALGQNQAPAQLNSYSSPVQLSGTTWNQIAAYDDGGRLATRSDGTAWTWGFNDNGGLGQNDRVNYSSPVQLSGTNWSGDITGKSTSFFALRSS